ncbi:MAG TPA: Gldg family protein [Planctomycetota bacterium]|nr:Gldg family protein [Planctomycetota bacterium]
MTRRASLALVAALVLASATVIFAVRLARHARARVELARAGLSRVDDATRKKLRSLPSPLLLTYYVSDRSRMPSQYREVERDVTDILESWRDASDGKVEFQIVDPDKHPDLAQSASRRGVARFRARTIELDGWSEQTIWSTLVIGTSVIRPPSIHGIGPDHIPRLQALLLEHLELMEHPRKPIVAIAAPAGFEGMADLRAKFAEKAEVVMSDFETSGALPMQADFLLWLDPSRADDAILRVLDGWLQTGRSVVIAGSARRGQAVIDGGVPALVLEDTRYPAQQLLSHYGLKPVHELVLDERCEEVLHEGNKVPAPFRLRCIALDQNFRESSLHNQPNGNLLFVAPTPFELDPLSLREKGWNAELLATTSDKSWMEPRAGSRFPLSELTRDRGEPVAKQLLMVHLAPGNPWSGSVLFCASASPFESMAREGFAHERLLRTLVDNFGSADRQVVHGAQIARPAPIPPLESGERAAWRAFTLVVPIGLLVLGLFRGAFGRAAQRAPAARRALRVGLVTAAGILLVAIAARASSALRIRLDLSEGKTNELAPQTRSIAERSRGADAVTAEILFSSSERLPPSMRPWPKRIAALLDELRASGADVAVTYTDPDSLDAAKKAALDRVGAGAFSVTTKDEEVTTARRVFAALRLSSRGRTEWLAFHDEPSIENLEFRCAFALWRLETGKRPRVAFASDVPRLTPAEAFDDQQAGLTAPSGTDVYAAARQTLAECDFEIVHVNPRDPKIPDGIDLLVWLQPRRDVCKMYEALARHLHGGGSAFLAVQHYNVQGRQYRGRSFDFVYWPQPQFTDVDNLWFPELGIDVDKEVLFDESKTRMRALAQVNRSATRPELEAQTSALPFVIRAAAARFSPDSPVTRQLGDQAFVWGSFIRLEDDRLRQLGLRATPLVTTSERTWTYPWKGGWIPNELLAGPPVDDGGHRAWRGKLPLAVWVEGTFPLPSKELKIEPPKLDLPVAASGPSNGAVASAPVDASASRSAPGKPGARLLLVACSEMFKNHRLLDSEFRADHFLINAAAALGLPPELAEIAARRPVSRGFDLPEGDAKLRWRAFAIAGFPLALVAFGLVRAAVRRRAPRIGAAA